MEKEKREINQQVSIFEKIIPDLVKFFSMEMIEEILDIDLHPVQVQVIENIKNLKQPMMSELSSTTGIQLSTLTKVIDKLVERGFVIRKPDPSDRRVVKVDLTCAGEKVLERFYQMRRKKIMQFLKTFNLEERKKLIEILQILHRRILDEEKKCK